MITFGFTLNTDADTFCTWLKDRSEGWRVGFTADEGRVLDLQKTRLSKRNSRTTCSFDVVKEQASKKGLFVKGVIQLLVSPAALAGQVDIRAVCKDTWALVCFSYVLKQIANAYPEAHAPIKRQNEEQYLDDSTRPTVEMPTGKRGRLSNADYDKAYENIKNGMSLQDAYEIFKQTVKYPDKTLWGNFRRAMNRRAKKDNDNKVT